MTVDRRRRMARRAALIAGSVAVLAGLAACNIVAPAVLIIEGRGSIPAAYELPELSTMIYVDDRSSQLPRSSLRRTISTEVGQRLIDQKVLVDVVDPRGAMAAAKQEQPTQPMTIEELGEIAGVQQVVYVEIRRFPPRSAVVAQPVAVATVKVIEVGREEPRTWPPEASGQQVTARLTYELASQPSSSELRRVQDELAAELGKEIAWLFYKHERPYLLGED
jgi:hypothetical protein